MMPRPILTLLAPAILLYSGAAQADESGPSSYDECITQTLKGVSSDVAANAIIASCRNMFPEPTATAVKQEEVAPVQEEAIAEQQALAPEQEEVVVDQQVAVSEQENNAPGASRNLTPEELSRLSATAFILGTAYRLTFDNANENVTITEVTIAVWDKSDPDSLREYQKSVRIPPQGIAKAKYTVVYVGEDLDFDWKVASAKGID
jgi:hypothetical protein